MRQVIYRPDRFTANLQDEESVEVRRIPDSESYALTAYDNGDGVLYRAYLNSDQVLRLAGYILATHSEAAGGEDFEGIGFAPATTSCSAVPSPDFVVVPPVGGAEHTNPLQHRSNLTQIVATAFSGLGRDAAGPAVAETEPGADAEPEEDLGLLHPDQERRLTALREAAELTRSTSGDRFRELAEWILGGRDGTEGGEQA